MPDSLLNPTPQFRTAEYGSPAGARRCEFCQQPLGATYYRLNSGTACASCVEKMQRERATDRHAAFVRAMAYGIGAALLGLIGYALLAIILQGWVISYMSIGVGWLVGTAMMKGSNGVGGRRYQIAAVLLTYAAVSMAAIPIWIHFANRQPEKPPQQQSLEDEQRQLEQEYGTRPSASQRQDSAEQQTAPQPQPAPRRAPPMSLSQIMRWLGRIALIGLASPFLELSGNGLWGAIGLLILFFGMQVAWRIARGKPFVVYGPFSESAQP